MTINTNKINKTESYQTVLRGVGCLNFSSEEKLINVASQENNIAYVHNETKGVSLSFGFVYPTIVTNANIFDAPKYYFQQCKKCKGTFA